MKSHLFFSLLLFATSSLATAQNVPVRPNHETSAALDAQKLASQRAAFAEAKEAAKAGSVAGAEQALLRLNKNKPATRSWHVETAQRFIHLATDSARDGHSDAVPALAARALQHLAEAERFSREDRQRAPIKSLAGFIHERLLGDNEAAKASYRTAAALDPQNVPAREHLARLEAPEKRAEALKSNK